MALSLTFSCVLSLFFFPAILSSSQSTFTCSRAAYYGSPDYLGTPRGACGYGEFGRSLNGGDVGAVSRLYRNGSGCGACYQVRCTHPQFCNQDGAKVVVTDYGQGDNTDFILSARAFVKLAKASMANELIALGVIDVEYTRISCQYPGYNMMLKITEHSKFPDYLALIIIYQAGQKDIIAVELWQAECREWRGMRRAYGGVWDMANPPRGQINARILTSDDSGQTWVQLNGAIPSDWKAGVAYDTAVQLA